MNSIGHTRQEFIRYAVRDNNNNRQHNIIEQNNTMSSEIRQRKTADEEEVPIDQDQGINVAGEYLCDIFYTKICSSNRIMQLY